MVPIDVRKVDAPTAAFDLHDGCMAAQDVGARLCNGALCRFALAKAGPNPQSIANGMCPVE
jgi:hypothetical protein